MNIYVLRRLGETNYDETAGWVVAAESSEAARKLCNDNDCDMWGDPGLWLDEARTGCECIGLFTDDPQPHSHIVMRDFRAG